MKYIHFITVLITINTAVISECRGQTPASALSPADQIQKPPGDTRVPFAHEGLVPDRETAIKIAEVVLFRLFGEDTITAQRPYTVKEEDFIWWINGNIPKEKLGFTFKIAISKQTGAILHLSLY
jgi:hypothetical protein